MRGWAVLLVIAQPLAGCTTTTESAFSRARRLDTGAGYYEYLGQHPSGMEAYTILQRLAELEEEEAFRQVEDQNTLAAYRAFAANQPTNKYVGEAARRAIASDAEALEWTVRIGSKAAYAGFAASYPASPYLPEVQERLRWLETAKIAFAVEGVSEADLRAAFDPNGLDPRFVLRPYGVPLDGQNVAVAMAMRKIRTTRQLTGLGTAGKTALTVCGIVAASGGYTPYILVTGTVGLLCMGGVLAVTAASRETIVAENWEVAIRPGDLAPGVDYYQVIPVATLAGALGHRKALASVGEADLLVWLVAAPTFPAGIARAALRHPHWMLVAEAGRILARREPFPLEFFLAMVDESSDFTRRVAVRALGKAHDGRAIPPLIRALATDTSADDVTRVAAAESLAALGDPQAVDPLIGALADPADFVRDAAAAALGVLGDRRAIAPLIARLADRTESVRVTAAHTLTRLTGEDFGIDQAQWQAWWEDNKTNLPMP